MRHRNAGTKILGVPHGSLAPAQAPSGGHGRAWAGLASPALSLDLTQEADKNDNQEDLNKGVMTQAGVMFIRLFPRQRHAALPWA